MIQDEWKPRPICPHCGRAQYFGTPKAIMKCEGCEEKFFVESRVVTQYRAVNEKPTMDGSWPDGLEAEVE